MSCRGLSWARIRALAAMCQKRGDHVPSPSKTANIQIRSPHLLVRPHHCHSNVTVQPIFHGQSCHPHQNPAQTRSPITCLHGIADTKHSKTHSVFNPHKTPMCAFHAGAPMNRDLHIESGRHRTEDRRKRWEEDVYKNRKPFLVRPYVPRRSLPFHGEGDPSLRDVRRWLYSAKSIRLDDFREYLDPFLRYSPLDPGLAYGAIMACQKSLEASATERVTLALTLLRESLEGHGKYDEDTTRLRLFNGVLKVIELNPVPEGKDHCSVLLGIMVDHGVSPDSRTWFKVAAILCSQMGPLPGLDAFAEIYRERTSQAPFPSILLPISRQHLQLNNDVNTLVSELEQRGHGPTLLNDDGFYMLLKAAAEVRGYRGAVGVISLMEERGVAVTSRHIGVLLETCAAKKMDVHTAHSLMARYESRHGNLLGRKSLKQMLGMCALSANVELALKYLSRAEEMGLEKERSALVSVLGCYGAAHRPAEGLEMLLGWEREGSVQISREFLRPILRAFAYDGDVDGVKKVLDVMADRKTPTTAYEWACLVKAHCNCDRVESALHVVKDLEAQGVKFMSHTYGWLLAAAARTHRHRLTDQLLTQMQTSGLSMDLTIAVPLLRIYGRQGNGPRLRWLVRLMNKEGMGTDQEAMSALVGALAHLQSPDDVHFVVRALQKTLLMPNTTMFNTLLKVLGRRNRYDALSLYCRMREMGITPDTQTYTVLVTSFVQAGDGRGAVRLFSGMRREGLCAPDAPLYNAIMAGYARWGDADAILELIQDMEGRGLKPTVRTYESLVWAHAAKGDVEGAEAVCKQYLSNEGLSHRAWNALVYGQAVRGDVDGVVAALGHMADQKVVPDIGTVHSIAALIDANHNLGVPVFTDRQGAAPSVPQLLPVLSGLASAGFAVTDRVYALLFGAYGGLGDSVNSVEVVREMERAGVTPSISMLSAMLHFFSGWGDVDRTQRLISTVMANQHPGVGPSAQFLSVAVSALARLQLVDDALALLKNTKKDIPNPSLTVEVFKPLVKACGQLGDFGNAASLLRMIRPLLAYREEGRAVEGILGTSSLVDGQAKPAAQHTTSLPATSDDSTSSDEEETTPLPVPTSLQESEPWALAVQWTSVDPAVTVASGFLLGHVESEECTGHSLLDIMVVVLSRLEKEERLQRKAELDLPKIESPEPQLEVTSPGADKSSEAEASTNQSETTNPNSVVIKVPIKQNMLDTLRPIKDERIRILGQIVVHQLVARQNTALVVEFLEAVHTRGEDGTWDLLRRDLMAKAGWVAGMAMDQGDALALYKALHGAGRGVDDPGVHAFKKAMDSSSRAWGTRGSSGTQKRKRSKNVAGSVAPQGKVDANTPNA